MRRGDEAVDAFVDTDWPAAALVGRFEIGQIGWVVRILSNPKAMW